MITMTFSTPLATVPLSFHLTFLALPAALVTLALLLAWRGGRRSGEPGAP